MLEKFKRKQNIKGTDEFLKDLLDEAIEFITDYTHQTKTHVEANMQSTVIDIAVIYYNRQGTEGLQSQSYSGASESYAEKLPPTIMAKLNRNRKCRR